jgi:hypothetical protein
LLVAELHQVFSGVPLSGVHVVELFVVDQVLLVSAVGFLILFFFFYFQLSRGSYLFLCFLNQETK